MQQQWSNIRTDRKQTRTYACWPRTYNEIHIKTKFLIDMSRHLSTILQRHTEIKHKQRNVQPVGSITQAG